MKTSDIKIGGIYENNRNERYKVVSLHEKTKSGHKKFKIIFLDYEWETIVFAQSIISGEIRNRMSPSVFGVGCIGNASSKNMRIWNLWHNMLSRCYNPKSKDYSAYGARGVRVDDRWLCFEQFVLDLPSITGYDNEKFNNGLLHLDKDILQNDIDNKVYSINTCVFVSSTENFKVRRTESYKKIFEATDPSGKSYIVSGIIQFAKANEMTAQNIKKCLDGEWKQYKGWRFRELGKSVTTIES